ncbi:LysR family transcriptional regulator [Alkalilimnicola sp. S0819]|uniref:LysR family transcriptional regulator n=1 Tax=Alkalilimnicola sp. S0819 TaxID=2613922 RepID=UPI00126275F2|nr:LysR family transcriptional regulator [Alkalilimnicola sp. S0819]KAB7623972.1 LysR family transcriptional regulator [Alkalilimnicola sp. S0819]MPQ16573.1 LysR family transcriptional regulator [Alkalilimnicola sp. S0819]
MKAKRTLHNIRSVDLNLLGIFDAIHRERNITRAARRLGMTQPAVSGALNRLRQLLDDPLFVKTAQGMEPTPRADELAEPISQALEDILDALSHNSGFDYANADHSFCLAMSDYSEFLLLPPLMRWLRAHAPHITLSTVPVVERTLPVDLESGLVDLAIGNIPALQSGCYRQQLVFEDFICVVRDDHPEIGEELTLEQFQEIPQVIFTPRQNQDTVDQVLSQQGLRRNIALRVPNYLTIIGVIAETDLIGVLPVRIARRVCRLAGLRMLPCPVEHPGVPVSQHWHVRESKNPANRWLRELLKELSAAL